MCTRATRPRIKIELTLTDKIVEVFMMVILLSMWLLCIAFYSYLPAVIPSHYNAAGDVDGTGLKMMIWTLPLIATLVFIGMTVAVKYPHTFNYYPTKITNDNAYGKYYVAVKMVRYLKLLVILFLAFLLFKTILIS